MTNVFKKYGMAIVAILMVVGFSAFKASEKSTILTGAIFEVDPDTKEILGQIATSELELPSECRTGSVEECAVWLDPLHIDSNGDPMFDNIDELNTVNSSEYNIYKRNI